MPEPLFHIALVHPEIPQNTGNVGRLCLAVGARLHLVHPLSFQTDEKAVRRAGLDYWKHVDVVEHADLDAFLAWLGPRRDHRFSSHGVTPYTRVDYAAGDVLVFGRESVGLPRDFVGDRGVRIPMVGATRSLNLSNAAAVVAYAALQRLRPELF
ncbi:MAG: tRNA (cytidine(34)-2'-O)-methyltransferase [Myxococcota bacterium]